LAKPIEYRRCGLGDAIVPVALSHHAGQDGAHSIAAVAQAAHYQPGLFECVENPQQGCLWQIGSDMDVVKRRNRLGLQGLQHLNSTLEASNCLHHCPAACGAE
jgi:hypothetical protein